MGWWKMNCGGGISDDLPSGHDGGLINAIPNRDTVEDHYMGDGPADIMGAAIHDIIAQYEETWGRGPYIEELEGCINFVLGPYRDGDIKLSTKEGGDDAADCATG